MAERGNHRVVGQPDNGERAGPVYPAGPPIVDVFPVA
jgi:hypothetical protein